ncbi:cobalt-factor II C(20)-methyltransferase [Salmonella enterica]|nr:cobalt-factor II C(20)-methyltransferase [Salmonella enterica]EDY2630860.1 cobalt-factor II C(20)-methyltransferase [Salmonella enterica]EHC7120608.1 cobalt-factor II C(20)-methyltransferase [Salmonella enterica]
MNTVKPESIALFCLTPGGVALAKKLSAMLPLTCFTSEKLREEGFIPFDGGFANTARQAFTTYTALIFIGATGIAVRVLAPLVNDKFSDPAVVVIDERGQHVISLLSGHAGGANALTRYLAGMLGADPVITTATDVNEMSALDTLAFQLNARMSDLRTAVKTVNQMLVSHQRVGLTVRAARILGSLDILYAPAGRKGGDSLALSIVRDYLGEQTEVRCCHFPMSADGAEKEAVWNEVAAALTAEVEAGKQVGFITLGDAMLFSTWIFLLQRIGCPEWLEIVPGVTSFAAIAARAKMPLAIERQSLAVISCTAPEAEIAQALQQHDSLVLMKVYGRFARIKALLAQAGLLECALMMSEATLPGEQCWRHLHEVNDDQALPYFSTILVNKQWEYAE